MRNRFGGRFGRSGFSLIEVMLALAVVAIGLVAVLGMIPHGIQASRDAADNTIIATIVHDTFNQLRQAALTTTWPPALPLNAYYDVAAANSTPGATANSYYHVQLATPLSTHYLLTVVATVTWPDKGTAVLPINTNVFVTEIANYQQ